MTTPWATCFEFMPDDVMDSVEASTNFIRSKDYHFRVIVVWRGAAVWSVNLGDWSPQQVWDNVREEWVYETSESDRTNTRFAKGEALTIAKDLAEMATDDRLNRVPKE